MFTYFSEKFISLDECDSIIKIGESHNLQRMLSSKFVNGKLVESEKEYDGNKRMGCYFTDEILMAPELASLTNKIINLSNNLKPFKSLEYLRVSKYSFNRYSSGDFLDWHQDKHEVLLGATLTFIIQLNDDYENGLIKFITNETEQFVPKVKGSVFIFDSNISHCVEPITKGYRYSLNVWPSSIKKASLI